MLNTNWKRAGIGACTAAALVVGAGLACAPAADALPITVPTPTSTGLLGTVGSVTSGVGGVVSGVLGSPTSPVPTTTSTPVAVQAGSGGVSVGVGGTTVGVTTGTGTGTGVGVDVGVTTGTGSGVGVVIGSTTSSTTGTVTVTDPSTPSTTPTTVPSGSSSDPVTTTPIVLTALTVAAQYPTVYPAKDGYRDSVAFTLDGITSDGLPHSVSGTLALSSGSRVVATWPITSTAQTITWNGRVGGRIVPGRYLVTASVDGSSGTAVVGSTAVDVSAKKLAHATQLLMSSSVSGTHRMAAKPMAGLAMGRVTLRVTAVAAKVTGRQYLVFTHAGKHLRIRIMNGRHTTRSVTIPRSFTSFTISHTWKKGTVRIRTLKYVYSFMSLK